MRARNQENTDSNIVRKCLDEFGVEKLLSREEEKMLAQEIKRGVEGAFEKFAQANLRLVVSIAVKYRENDHHKFLDFVQEGTVGLMKAIKKFEWERGYKFSTHATWWIRQAIERAIKNSNRTIRLPVHAGDDLSKLQKAKNQLEKSLERTAASFELVEHTGFSEEKVAMLLSNMHDTKSLHDPLSDDVDATEVGAMIEDEGVISQERIVERKKMRRDLRKALMRVLTKKERRYFLMVNLKESSNDEIMERLGIGKGTLARFGRMVPKKLKNSLELKKYEKIMTDID